MDTAAPVSTKNKMGERELTLNAACKQDTGVAAQTLCPSSFPNLLMVLGKIFRCLVQFDTSCWATCTISCNFLLQGRNTDGLCTLEAAVKHEMV